MKRNLPDVKNTEEVTTMKDPMNISLCTELCKEQNIGCQQRCIPVIICI
jgi:hypothetical protein